MPSDRDDVVDLLHRHAEGMDLRDWPGFRSVFTQEVDIDYESHRPGQRFTTSADEWTAHVSRRLGRIRATQHALSNIRVFVDGDSARATAYVRADHLEDRPGGKATFTIVGRYDDRLVRTADGWRICAVRLDSWWHTGDRAVLEL
jgi:3-phenylpropionate/cinnamic acid dioxygenase small subunit